MASGVRSKQLKLASAAAIVVLGAALVFLVWNPSHASTPHREEAEASTETAKVIDRRGGSPLVAPEPDGSSSLPRTRTEVPAESEGGERSAEPPAWWIRLPRRRINLVNLLSPGARHGQDLFQARNLVRCEPLNPEDRPVPRGAYDSIQAQLEAHEIWLVEQNERLVQSRSREMELLADAGVLRTREDYERDAAAAGFSSVQRYLLDVLGASFVGGVRGFVVLDTDFRVSRPLATEQWERKLRCLRELLDWCVENRLLSCQAAEELRAATQEQAERIGY